MYTFFSENKKENRFVIEGEEFKHLTVRRIRKGEKIGIIFRDSLYECELVSFAQNKAFAQILKKLEIPIPPVNITLLQSVPLDLKLMDSIIQKAVEVGINQVIPIITERSLRDTERVIKRIDRWKRIAKEAMKQCNRPLSMEINHPVHIIDIKENSAQKLLLHPDKRSIPIGSINPQREVYLAVGPEGGFSHEDIKVLKLKGFTLVKILPYTMRTETAGIVASAIIMNSACP